MSMSAPASSWLFSSDTSRYSTRARLLFMGLSFAIGILTFVLYLAIWYLCSRRRRRLLLLRGGQHLPGSEDGHGGGMSADVIAALPTRLVARGCGAGTAVSGPVVDCPVCLGQAEEGEKVRRLPKCGHEFHTECVDAWLRAHSTCPMCRAAVVGPSAAAAAKKQPAEAAPAVSPPAMPLPLPPV